MLLHMSTVIIYYNNASYGICKSNLWRCYVKIAFTWLLFFLSSLFYILLHFIYMLFFCTIAYCCICLDCFVFVINWFEKATFKGTILNTNIIIVTNINVNCGKRSNVGQKCSLGQRLTRLWFKDHSCACEH